MNIKAKHLILAIFSLLLVGATLLVPVKLESKSEVAVARLGYPAYFLEQNFSAKYEKYYFFPTWEKVDWSGKSSVVKFSPVRLAVDFVLIFAGCEIFIYILETINFAIRKEK